jgi:hypothetical protein
MPFKKVGNNDFVSPSGRHFNGAQVRLYHANGDKFPGQKKSETSNGKLRKGGSSPQPGSSMRRPNSRSR